MTLAGIFLSTGPQIQADGNHASGITQTAGNTGSMTILAYGPVVSSRLVADAELRGVTVVWKNPTEFAAITDFTPYDMIYVRHSDFDFGVLDRSGLYNNDAWHDGSGGVRVGNVILTGLHSDYYYKHSQGHDFNMNVLNWMDDGNSHTIGILAFFNVNSKTCENPIDWLPGADIEGSSMSTSDAIRPLTSSYTVMRRTAVQRQMLQTLAG